MNRSGQTTRAVFEDPIVQLAAICPICALSALSPMAALSALSPVLRLFNPAINPAAALLSFRVGGLQASIAAGIQARVSNRMQGLTTKVYRLRLAR